MMFQYMGEIGWFSGKVWGCKTAAMRWTNILWLYCSMDIVRGDDEVACLSWPCQHSQL